MLFVAFFCGDISAPIRLDGHSQRFSLRVSTQIFKQVHPQTSASAWVTRHSDSCHAATAGLCYWLCYYHHLLCWNCSVREIVVFQAGSPFLQRNSESGHLVLMKLNQAVLVNPQFFLYLFQDLCHNRVISKVLLTGLLTLLLWFCQICPG